MTEETSKLVLVVEDDEDIRELVSYRLTHTGFEVLAANDGDEALRLAHDRHPDLAIVDVMMPRVDGYELTRRLRADEQTADIPVILLTGRAQEIDVARGFAAGADDYIRKPFSPRELSMRAEAIIARR